MEWVQMISLLPFIRWWYIVYSALSSQLIGFLVSRPRSYSVPGTNSRQICASLLTNLSGLSISSWILPTCCPLSSITWLQTAILSYIPWPHPQPILPAGATLSSRLDPLPDSGLKPKPNEQKNCAHEEAEISRWMIEIRCKKYNVSSPYNQIHLVCVRPRLLSSCCKLKTY